MILYKFIYFYTLSISGTEYSGVKIDPESLEYIPDGEASFLSASLKGLSPCDVSLYPTFVSDDRYQKQPFVGIFQRTKKTSKDELSRFTENFDEDICIKRCRYCKRDLERCDGYKVFEDVRYCSKFTTDDPHYDGDKISYISFLDNPKFKGKNYLEWKIYWEAFSDCYF